MPSSAVKMKHDNKEERYENPKSKSREKCLILSTFPVNLSLRKVILHLAPYNEYFSIGFIDVRDYAN